ncbi:hypothetical protein H6G27_34310 [Nostoc linckia FACHB-104]|nr:hypothetical protein [Nostoc linckia FACHB-104]MBD2214883.1 hypothetical protein [Nostoc linckia FACHB-104]
MPAVIMPVLKNAFVSDASRTPLRGCASSTNASRDNASAENAIAQDAREIISDFAI